MQRLDTPELLDEHDAPEADVERSLRDLQRFNRWCGGTRVYRKMVKKLLVGAPHPAFGHPLPASGERDGEAGVRGATRPFIIDLGAGTADLVDSLGGRGVAVDWNLRHLLYQRER